MDKIVRVDMTGLKISVEYFPTEYIKFGGRGLNAMIISKEVNASCDPLGKYNKLIFSPGLFGGTIAPSSGRLSVSGKSPLTGGIKEANSGGPAGDKLARLGIKAVILEGKPAEGKCYVLKLGKECFTLHPSEDLAGFGNYALAERLRANHGEKATIVSIGVAGERGYANSTVAVTDVEGKPTRHAARGGLGAVMGSKGIKAVVIDASDTEAVKVEEKDRYRGIVQDLIGRIREDKAIIKGLSALGTPMGISMVNALGGLVTRNFSAGSFDQAENLSAERISELNKARGGRMHHCMPGCMINCSIVFHGKDGKYVTSGLEYETLVMLGSNCGIADLDAIAMMSRMCDDFGMDTIEMGGVIGVAMEAGLAKFGDATRAMELIEEAGKGTVLGRLLGAGVATVGKVLGVKRIPSVKGQGMPGWDPRVVKMVGVTYATSPMGADHTAGLTLKQPLMSPEGQVERSREEQIIRALVDCTGICFFAFHQPEFPLDLIAKLFNARYSFSLTEEEVLAIGRAVLKTENAFNMEAGITMAQWRLPDFLREEPLPPHNSVFDVPDNEIKKLYDLCER